jgi:eukaryotic-like serine/threonine-protein kinase
MARALSKAGRYEIVSELGRGSMGVVYKGFDPVIGRSVAIKTMLIEGLTGTEFQEFKARFQREAQAAGILAHPNIVTVYDFGEDAGVLFLAMEFLDGKSLQDLVEKQTIMPVETIIPMFEQVCSALDHAHTHNIVHRDIKPANIMILNSGLVKVTDFGIAKIMSMGMTQAGQILGTPNYMSPEQVKGRKVDGRSDIFALGVILYELVTGEKPFGGQNITTVIYKIINENPIPPRELDATIHAGLSFVISKALAKSPEERFQTCRELSESLKNYKNLGGGPAPNATVVMKVPPLQASPADPARTAKRPAPLEVQPLAVDLGSPRTPTSPPGEQRPSRPVAPPAFAAIKPAPKGTSPLVWALLAFLVVGGIVGGGYYFLFMKNAGGTTQVIEETKPPSNPTPPAPVPTESATPVQGSPAEQTGSGQTSQAPQQITPAQEVQKAEPAQSEKTPAPSVEKKTEAKKVETPPPVVESPALGLKYGKVFVTSTPQGAQVTVDGRSDPDWVTPRTLEGLAAGTHTLILSKEGFSSAHRTVSVSAGRTQPLNVDLATLNSPTVPGRTAKPPSPQQPEETPATSDNSNGVLVIQTVPPGIEVAIDGNSAGRSPVRQVVSPGDHTVKLLQSGVEIYSGTVQVKAGQVAMRKYNLGP